MSKWIERQTFKGLKPTDLYFKNFRGENRFNPKDKRPTFAIKLDPVLAETLEKAGWYVRWTKVREDAPEDVEPIPYLKVTANMEGKRPPQVNSTWEMALQFPEDLNPFRKRNHGSILALPLAPQVPVCSL